MNRVMKDLVPFNKPTSKDLIKNILLYPSISQLLLYEGKEKCHKNIKIFYVWPGHLCFGVEIYKACIQ